MNSALSARARLAVNALTNNSLALDRFSPLMLLGPREVPCVFNMEAHARNVMATYSRQQLLSLLLLISGNVKTPRPGGDGECVLMGMECW